MVYRARAIIRVLGPSSRWCVVHRPGCCESHLDVLGCLSCVMLLSNGVLLLSQGCACTTESKAVTMIRNVA